MDISYKKQVKIYYHGTQDSIEFYVPTKVFVSPVDVDIYVQALLEKPSYLCTPKLGNAFYVTNNNIVNIEVIDPIV